MIDFGKSRGLHIAKIKNKKNDDFRLEITIFKLNILFILSIVRMTEEGKDEFDF